MTAPLRPRILTMFWGEDDSVFVELEGAPEAVAVLLPGDSYGWTPPSRPHLAFEVRLVGPVIPWGDADDEEDDGA